MPRKFNPVVNAKPEETEILLHGPIGKSFWSEDGISGKDVTNAINAVPKGRKITIGVNSQGGSVGEGMAIYNAIARRSEDVTVRIDGYALSIASFFPLAANRVVSPKSSIWMIHKAWNWAEGNADQLRKDAEMLDQHDQVIVDAYARKTGKTKDEIIAAMSAETWLTGAEAIGWGLADEEGEVDARFEPVDLACYKNAPKNFAEFLESRRVPVGSGRTTNPPLPAAGQHHKKDTMQTAAILALLKQNGKELPADAKEETILAALAELVTNNKITQAEADKLKKATGPVIINADRFAAMEADLKREREARIKQEFENLSVDRPYLDAGEWLPKLYADETLMDNVRKMPLMPAGGAEPVRAIGIRGGSSIIDDYRKLEPGAERKAFALKHWHGLAEAHKSQGIQNFSALPLAEQVRRLAMGPQAANTYSATLVTDRLADGLITTIGTKLAGLRAFSREFGTDVLKPKATVQVRKVTATSAVQTNPTNFESGDSTTTPSSVAVDQISKSFHVTNDELNKGHQVMQVAEKNAQTFANAISDIWTAIVTTANFSTALQIGAAATFDASDLAPIYAAAKNYGSKNLILDGGHLAYLLPTDKFKFRLGEEGAYNFDLIAEQNRWTGATTNTVGFVCDPNAIAVASGLPASLPASEFIELGTVELPNLGLTIQVCHWFSRGGRVHWMSYDVMFGAIAGDTTAGEVLVTS